MFGDCTVTGDLQVPQNIYIERKPESWITSWSTKRQKNTKGKETHHGIPF